ncbi:MAG: hypothetical protein WAM39_17935 [Bryobacteraceae bacterium]
MKKRVWSIPAKILLTAIVFSAVSKGALFGFEYVIDVLAEQRLLTEVAQTAQVIKNTLDELQLAQTMAGEVTHASYRKSLLMQIILNPPTNLYGETTGWGQIFTGGASVNPTWSNSTIPVEQDRYYTNGPGTTFAATTATAEIADSAAEDSLAAVQQFYQNKPVNNTATQALQADFQNGGNDTYLGQARIANGIGFQELSTQQDLLTQITNLTRIETVMLKQVRDQNTDGNNFITDLHQYQATQGVSIGGGLASEFQAYSLP